MRALWFEIRYDGLDAASVSAPLLDFFGLPHGRAVPYHSALTAAQEGRGFNAYFPMPFRRRFTMDIVNGSSRALPVYFQLDYTLERELAAESGYLHAAFGRENPTTMGRDFVIASGLRGPGRFLGCVVGVRLLDTGPWYGEGEVKVFRDDDTYFPTICGTGLEDYVGSAWGMGPHAAHYAGAPLDVRAEGAQVPEFVGFYRWHVLDPVVFREELRVTIQQIGFASFREGEEAAFEAYAAAHPAAGAGWGTRPGTVAAGIAERVDDYCATSFVYCREPQAVRPLDLALALEGIERRDYERPHPMERAFFGGGQ
jgi:hypothetical protein